MVRRQRVDPPENMKPVSLTTAGTKRLKPRGQAKLTPEVQTHIVELYSSGLKTTAILEIIGISYYAFRRFLEKNPDFNATIEQVKITQRVKKLKELEEIRGTATSNLKKASKHIEKSILSSKELEEEYTLQEQADIVSKVGGMSVKVLEKIDPDFKDRQEVELKEETPEDIEDRRKEKIRNLKI